MQHEPRQPTQPLNRAKTTPFGDAFVSSGAGGANGTRPLRTPTGNLKEAVSAKLIEVKKELDYVRHLITLFGPSIAILRFSIHLSTLPELPTMESFDQPDPVPECDPPPEAQPEEGAEEELEAERMVPAPDPFAELGIPQRKFGRDIAGVLVRDPRIKQRAQVALYQYDEVVRAYEDGNRAIDGIASCAFEEAWERLQAIGIERTKGKAYAVCGFWDNFKADPVICKLFPPPTQQNARGTQPLNMNALNPSSGALKPLPAPPAPAKKPPEPNGLLGKLKGFFS